MGTSILKRKREVADTSRKIRVLEKPIVRAAFEAQEEEEDEIEEGEESPDDNEDGSEDDEGEELDPQEIFRRHFESRFAPIPEKLLSKKSANLKPKLKTKEGVEADDMRSDSEGEYDGGEVDEKDDESDFSGLSDDESAAITVIDHSTSVSTDGIKLSKAELKKFMSSKAPSLLPTETVAGAIKAVKPADDADPSEATNLKNDLALQRLLSESHLLDQTSHQLEGKNRHKATDLRLQGLGAKTSILVQEKMPLSHKRGIMKKAAEKEEFRRREARENGIILERAKNAKKGGEKKRERGVGAPGVGRFSGGTLSLSKKDIAEIEGPKRTMSSGKGKRGGRGGKRGGKR
jgi:hypothetical protein